MNYLYIFLISAFSATLQGALGFGYAIVGMAFFPFVLPYVSSVTLCNVMSLSSNVMVSARYYRHIQWKKIWLPLALSLVASTVASRLVMTQGDGVLKQILGVFLVLLALYFLLFKSRIRIKATPVSGSVCGLLSGLGSGFFSINGPPMVVYFMAAAEDDNKKYLATIQMFFLLLNVYTILMRILNGAFTMEVLLASAAGLVGVGAGTVLGLMLFKKLNFASLYKFVYLFMAVMGVSIFINA